MKVCEAELREKERKRETGKGSHNGERERVLLRFVFFVLQGEGII